MNIIEEKYNWNGVLAQRSKIDLIVLHHAEASNCTAQDIHKWHLRNGWSGLGYHYFIRKNGQIYRGRPENTIGSHASGFNSTSIGICFEGRYQKEIMPEAQLKAGQELVESLQKKYGIKKVLRHCDVNNTTCPGVNFPYDRMIGESENLILSFQKAALADGIKFPKYGCDGKYGTETQNAMKKCVVKRRYLYKYKNCTKLVQRLLDITQDGLCGKDTEAAIKNFQKKNNLVVDGCVGLVTWKKLLGID